MGRTLLRRWFVCVALFTLPIGVIQADDIARTRISNDEAGDRLEIEQLRRLYAKATDAIGSATPESIERGRAIYHRIFTTDVQIRTVGKNPLTASNPDAWLDIVHDALKDYAGTQHLIGTQLVSIDGDQAMMESYVNAWHQNADGSTFVFIGTYLDKCRKTHLGWQIYDMTLRQSAGGMIQVDSL